MNTKHFTYRLREVKIGKAFLELIVLVNRVLHILLVKRGLHLIDLAEQRHTEVNTSGYPSTHAFASKTAPVQSWLGQR